jgi:hypothetical protein
MMVVGAVHDLSSFRGVAVKLKSLSPFVPPPPREPEVCRACKVFTPEVLVPNGHGALPMCWLCAHHVVEHGTGISQAYAARCECSHDEIFPQRYVHGDVDYTKPRTKEELLRGSSLSDRSRTRGPARGD